MRDDCPQETDYHGDLRQGFYLAHGDGLGDPDNKFKFLRKMFQPGHAKGCSMPCIHGLECGSGLTWAKHSRMKRADGKEPPYMGEDREFLVNYTKQYMQTHTDVDYFIYGHRHIELDLMLSRKAHA